MPAYSEKGARVCGVKRRYAETRNDVPCGARANSASFRVLSRAQEHRRGREHSGLLPPRII